ncbi:MAG: metallophosphoesterase family protein [Candidatus Krumholzibacteria bacterium]|nr:metallophosphoesterase family protein [Candidatus Krumholzibacteria bacterium]
MKVFICSDIHGNVRALDAVLAVYRKEFPCRLLFLGDCIGYGPHPDACLERILNLPRARYIMGNHEWAFLNRSERVNLNFLAAQALSWSEDLLMGRFDQVIRDRFQMEHETSDYLAVHSSPFHPERWDYISTYIDADEAFYNRDFRLCFVGHTHLPAVFTFKHGEKGFNDGVPFRLDPDDRYIINPGSVGQPRDMDPRAACCVFDPSEGTIALYRCEYNVEAETEDFRSAGLPPYLGERLLQGV